MMTIVTVVSLYNPNSNNIETISRYLPYLDRCILMDDSEEQTSTQLLEKLIKNSNVEYVWNEGNVGLCKSLNAGIKKAIELGADWILIMDSDSDFYNDILSVYKRTVASKKYNQVALLAPQHNYNRHKRIPQVGIRVLKYAMLSGCLLNVDAIKAIGMFDERFFIDGLDYEWCLRAVKNHYKVIECSEAVINHNPANEKQLRILGKTVFRYGWDSADRYYYQFRAALLIHDLYHVFSIDVVAAYKLLKALILFDNKKEYLLSWKCAKKDYCREYYGKYECR